MTEHKPEWKVFEDAVRAIITRHREFFGLESVEPGVTKVQGKSGYEWNIDVVGNKSGSQKTVIFEVRKRKRNAVPEEIGALAYKIQDTDSEQGYLVTKLDRGFSNGADQIAGFEQIGHIEVAGDSTPEYSLMKCLKAWFVDVADKFEYEIQKDSVRLLVQDKDGNIVRQVSEKELDAGNIDWQQKGCGKNPEGK
jgi:hypothetical protein